MKTTPDYLVTSLNIIKGAAFEQFIFITDANGVAENLAADTLQAELRDRPGGTLLATFTCTTGTFPPYADNSQGWVKLTMADTVTTAIPTGYHRGTWALLMSESADNPTMVAAGPAEINQQPTVWA